jgi:hypothetical protein
MQPFSLPGRIGRGVVAIALVLAVGALAGCLERKERIIVRPDGTVHYEITYRSDSPNELEDGDAMPSASLGWIVERRTEKESDGKTVHVLDAQRDFAAGADLPHSFAGSAANSEEVYLHFPTTLTVERRPDGLYYHFHRLYEPREWARYEVMRERLAEELGVSSLLDGETKDFTDEERLALTRLLVRFELEKWALWGREALREVAPHAPQDAWLRARRALLDLADQVNYEQLSSWLAMDEGRDQLLAQAAAQLEDTAASTLVSGLSGHGVDPGAFRRCLERHRRRYQVTEDLNDDSFEIQVTMPGRVIGSNADAVGVNSATWRFGGLEMHDRPVELMVTSVVTN